MHFQRATFGTTRIIRKSLLILCIKSVKEQPGCSFFLYGKKNLYSQTVLSTFSIPKSTNMDQNEQQSSSLFSMNMDAQNSYALRSLASWAKVLGIVSIIMAIIFVIIGIMVQQVISSSSAFDSYPYRRGGMSASGLGGIGLAVYVLMGIIYGLGGIFALNAGNKISGGLHSNNMETLNSGIANARNFFALWAILLIIFLLFMLLGILGNLGS